MPYHRERGRPVVLVLTLILGGLFLGYYFALLAPNAVMPLLLPVAVLAGLVIWALPDMRSAPTRLLSWLLLAFLVALPLWPNYLALALPGLPWITVLRIISGPMILLLLICVSVSAEFRRQTTQSISASAPLSKLLLLFILLQSVSLLPALIFGGGLAESIEALMLAQINWTAIFFLSAYVFLYPGRSDMMIALLLLVAGALCLIGIQEWRISAVPWAGHIPSFLKIEDPLVEKVLSGSARAATGIHRVQASYTTSLGFAEFLALITPFALHIAVRGRQLAMRIAAGTFMPLLLWIIILTDSRLGVVGFFLSCFFYLLIYGVILWRSNRRSLMGPAIVLAYPMLFAGFLISTFLVQRLARMVWGGGAASYSTQARIEQWDRGVQLLIANPLGYGIGRGGITLGYVNQAGQGTIDSYFLLLLLEYGPAGFLIFFGMFAVALWKGGQTIFRRNLTGELTLLIPLMIAIADWIIVKSIFAQPDNHPLIFAMLGMTTALICRAGEESAFNQSSPARPAGRAARPSIPKGHS